MPVKENLTEMTDLERQRVEKNSQPTELLVTPFSCAFHTRETIQMNKMCVNMCYCVTALSFVR